MYVTRRLYAAGLTAGSGSITSPGPGTQRTMATVANAYCERLGISVPSLAATRVHPEANTYALLIVTLLEHGRPMTLDEVARRFEGAGIACADDAYVALKRCRPAGPRCFATASSTRRRAVEKRRAAHADELAVLRRVIVHAFPTRSPRIVVLVDVEKRELATYLDEQLADLGPVLERYEVLCGVDIRATLRELAIEPGIAVSPS